MPVFEYKLTIYSARPKPENLNDLPLVRRCIRTLLTKGTNESLPITYEAIYSTCRSIVCVAGKGEGLYLTLKLEVEQALGPLARGLLSEVQTCVQWLDAFVDVCNWFETQVVGVNYNQILLEFTGYT
jgi:cullin-4